MKTYSEYIPSVSKSLLIVLGTSLNYTNRVRATAPIWVEGHCPPSHPLKKKCLSKNIHLELLSMLFSLQSKRRDSNCSAHKALGPIGNPSWVFAMVLVPFYLTRSKQLPPTMLVTCASGGALIVACFASCVTISKLIFYFNHVKGVRNEYSNLC